MYFAELTFKSFLRRFCKNIYRFEINKTCPQSVNYPHQISKTSAVTLPLEWFRRRLLCFFSLNQLFRVTPEGKSNIISSGSPQPNRSGVTRSTGHFPFTILAQTRAYVNCNPMIIRLRLRYQIFIT